MERWNNQVRQIKEIKLEEIGLQYIPRLKTEVELFTPPAFGSNFYTLFFQTWRDDISKNGAAIDYIDWLKFKLEDLLSEEKKIKLAHILK